MINDQTVATLLGDFGIGGIAGMLLQYYLNKKTNHEQTKYPTKLKKYLEFSINFFKLTQKIENNNFDIQDIDKFIADLWILGSNKLNAILVSYKSVMIDCTKIINTSNPDEMTLNDLKSQLYKLNEDIYVQLREDLDISTKGMIMPYAPNEEIKIKKLPQKEINTKYKQEVKDIKKLEKKAKKDAAKSEEKRYGDQAKENIKLPQKTYAKILPQIENAALAKFERKFKHKIGRQVSILNLPEIRFDGLFSNDKKKELYMFEVKVFPTIPVNKNGDIMTYIYITALRSSLTQIVFALTNIFGEKTDWRYIITIIVVLNTQKDFFMTAKKIETLKDEFNSAFSLLAIEIRFKFYNLRNAELDLSEE